MLGCNFGGDTGVCTPRILIGYGGYKWRFATSFGVRSSGVKRLLNHTNRLLLMAQRGKAAESEVISPVESSVLCWVLHAIRPVALALDILRYLLSPFHVLLLGLLVLHDLVVYAIELNSIVFLFFLSLLQ